MTRYALPRVDADVAAQPRPFSEVTTSDETVAPEASVGINATALQPATPLPESMRGAAANVAPRGSGTPSGNDAGMLDGASESIGPTPVGWEQAVNAAPNTIVPSATPTLSVRRLITDITIVG